METCFGSSMDASHYCLHIISVSLLLFIDQTLAYRETAAFTLFLAGVYVISSVFSL